MPDWTSTRYIGRLLIALGVVFVAGGLLFLYAGRLPGLGRLPGDLVLRGRLGTVYLPITTSILVSILLTIFLNWVMRR